VKTVSIAKSLVIGLLFAAILGANPAGDEPLTARVLPFGCVAPCDIMIQAFIERHASNRSVQFVIDSGAFYVSSVAELEGDRAPRSKEIRFRMLPAGTYDVQVKLFGTDGERGSVLSRIRLW
jgi:hypothetical protein